VWPEVAFKNLGWVPFYPVPQPTAGRGAAAPSVGEPAERHALDRAVAASRPPRPQGSSSPPAAPRARMGGQRSSGYPLVVVVGGVLVAVPLGYLVLGVAARRRLRHRRRSGPAREKIVGAWQESVDALARLGPAGTAPSTGVSTGVTSSMTAAETVRWAAERLGVEAGSALGDLADLLRAAVFSARAPGAADADRAWRDCARLTGEVARVEGRLARLRRLAEPPWTVARRRVPRLAPRLAAEPERVPEVVP
jgi:hypothetical protein